MIMKIMEQEEDGTHIVHMRYLTPVFTSDRSCMLAMYEEKRPDGTLVFFSGSKRLIKLINSNFSKIF